MCAVEVAFFSLFQSSRSILLCHWCPSRLVFVFQEARKRNTAIGSVVRKKSSLFGKHRLKPADDNLLSKTPSKPRPHIPFARVTQDLLPDKQKIPLPKPSLSPRDGVNNAYVTNVRVEYPARKNSSPKPASSIDVQPVLPEKGQGDTSSNNFALLRKSWQGGAHQDETIHNGDQPAEGSKSVYNEVIRALKKTHSPMYAELNGQTEHKEANSEQPSKLVFTAATPKKVERQLSKTKKRRPDRVSAGNTPADVRNALAALNDVIDDEEERNTGL